MRVLGFGTYDLTRHPRVGIVLDGLRARGADVTELNAPLGLSTADRVAMLRRPWRAYRLALLLVARWSTLAFRSVRARRAGRFDVIIVGYLGHFDVLLARLLFPRSRIALDLMIFAVDTARDRGVDRGLKLRLLDLLDRTAIRAAHVVLLDTDEHCALLPASARGKAVVVPVGAPPAWFAAGASVRGGDGPLRVAFFGLFTPLQGATVIGDALHRLAARSDITATMIGTGQDLEAARAAAMDSPQVTWRTWVDNADLPELVADHDVCLGIVGTTPKAFRVVPNKVYQGAAASCAVVTSDTAPQRRMLGDAACYVPAGDPEALAAALGRLADDRQLLASLRSAARAVALRDFSPHAVVEPLWAAHTR
jgi:glycosyltransferase involved in cell wall biosynthesis